MNNISLPASPAAQPIQPIRNQVIHFAASANKPIIDYEQEHLNLKNEGVFPDIPLPKATQQSYGTLIEECLLGQKRITTQIPRFVRLYFQLRSEQKKAEQYLPSSVQKHLRQYHYSRQGLYDWWFNKSEFLKKTAVIKGTAAIKDAQAEAEFAQAQLVNWEMIRYILEAHYRSINFYLRMVLAVMPLIIPHSKLYMNK